MLGVTLLGLSLTTGSAGIPQALLHWPVGWTTCCSGRSRADGDEVVMDAAPVLVDVQLYSCTAVRRYITWTIAHLAFSLNKGVSQLYGPYM